MLTHFLEVFLGWDRETYTPPAGWLDERIERFRRWTLPSLRAGRWYPQLVLQVGPRSAARMLAEPWPDDVTVATDHGREVYSRASERFLAITRCDSDDLFHREAAGEAYAAALDALRAGRRPAPRLVFSFPDYFAYNELDRFLTFPGRAPKSTPFFTQLFARSTVQRWPEFERLHFNPHGWRSGESEAARLRPDRVLVVKHASNTSNLKRGLAPVRLTPAAAQARAGVRVSVDPAEIRKIFAEFGHPDGPPA